KKKEEPTNDKVLLKNKSGVLNPRDSMLFELEALLNDTALTYAGVGFCIYDDDADTMIIQRNQNLSLVPASTTKLFTTAAALEILGESACFRTSLQYSGSIQGRTLKGNVYIRGGGDPTLGSSIFSSRYFMSGFANAVARLGIDSINGAVIGDARIFNNELAPFMWTWGELGSVFCAGVSGLSIYDNMFSAQINVGRKGRYKLPVNGSNPYLPGVYVVNNLVSGGGAPYYNVLSAPFTSELQVYGADPGSASINVYAPLPDPPYTAAYDLLLKLKAKGIRVSDSATTMRTVQSANVGSAVKDNLYGNRREISAVYSPPVSSIVYQTNQFSNNFFAEHLMRQIGLRSRGYGSTEAGIKAVYSFLKTAGIDTRGMFLFDGSGMARANGITAKQLIDLLLYMKKSKHATSFYNSLSVVGKSGTFKGNCLGTEAVGRAVMKGGTLLRVKNWAGYINCKSGKKLVISFMANNFTCTTEEMREKFEKVLVKMSKM
ncbi:MAG: D-alanyl-D-alanine carboxypeptidase/D-alanyl-D-alanine-endopeptidase, partial [Bacteroidetes bacterium]|nr:D-alanyl-D-alanine carboxypeptidase/D-alanyl-D-alanine-endopeptidase [Bacteroidota bacterium]